MGDFNVCCSISNISIDSGDKVVFIPLIFSNGQRQRLVQGSYLMDPECYFAPFSLPIQGVYDGYGSLEKIVRDENVEAIEKFFGIPIGKFISIISEQREWTSFVGELFKAYMENQKLLSDFSQKFDESFLMGLKFTKLPNGRFVYEDIPYEVELVEEPTDKYGYRIYDKEGTCVAKSSEHVEKDWFLNAYRKVSGYLLNISKDNQEKVKLLEQLSGMYVLKEVYDSLAKYELEETSMVNSCLTADIAVAYGFKPVSKEEQPIFDEYHPELYRKEGFPYDLKIGRFGSVLVHERYKEYYLLDHKRHVKTIRSIWEKATGTKPEETFPEPVDMSNVTDEEFTKIKHAFRKLTGVSLGMVHTEKDKYTIYSVKEFKECWHKTTGEDLNTSEYESISKYDTEYDQFRELVMKYKKELEVIEKLKDVDPSFYLDAKNYIETTNPFKAFSHLFNNCEFSRIFEKWKYFEALYKDCIIEGKLKEEFKMFRAFYGSMYSCNKFFFPAMNGGQYGDYKATKMLLNTSLKIVEEKLKKFEEEE